MQKTLAYILNMLPYMLCALPLLVLLRLRRQATLRQRGLYSTAWHEIGLCFFVLLMVGLASQTIVPPLEFHAGLPTVQGLGQGRVNLTLFKVFKQTAYEVFVHKNISYFLINFVGNIVMFMPIGLFLPLLWRNMPFWKVCLLGLLCSLGIELCQLPVARGTDVDDLWLNTLGAVLGYLLYLLLRAIAPKHCAKYRVRRLF